MKNPALTRWLTSPGGLATRLRTVRTMAGISGAALADGAGQGWSKAKVSKIENGTQLPSAADVEAWAEATRADPTELLALLDEANRVHTSWASRLSSGQADNQAAYAELIRQTKLMWTVDREVIPGELQTVAYATAILTQSLNLHGGTLDIDAAVAHRMERQSLLALPSRRYKILIGEAALRNQIVPPINMIEQLELIGRIARFPNVQLGVLSFHRPLTLFPHTAFGGFDNEVVLVELPNGEIAYDQPDDINTYRQVFDTTMADAATDTAAIAIIEHIVNDWHDLVTQ
jgi:transcriptional regulator with XRE-family HTH domain